MIQSWAEVTAKRVPCKRCKSVYEKLVRYFPIKDSDHFDCEVCGQQVESWNDTAVPSYRLVERRAWPRMER